MTYRGSAGRVGEDLASLETPCLILDLDQFEKNLELARASLKDSGVALRPHAKSHKCPEIARRQIGLGAVGVCCQKVSEAEVFVEAGISDVMVSNQVVGAKKISRLVALAKQAAVSVAVDNADNARDLHAAAIDAGVKLDVFIEIEVGMNRCGIAPGAPALELARVIHGLWGLRLCGLQAYHGAAQHWRTLAERKTAIGKAVELARQTRALIEQDGIACPRITGAGTGSYLLEAQSGVYNEVQPGSYVFMDVDYGKNDWDHSGMPPFGQSLFVLTSVMSASREGHAVCDAGLKASSVDSGLPVVADRKDVEYARASDEHGVLKLAPGVRLALGEKLKLIPGHCDPTVNLYDEIVCIRKSKVESIWPISARGALW